MAAKREKKAPSAPIELTQEQVNMARKGHSERLFATIEKSSRAKKSTVKSRARRRV
jgi:hypothetical protein